MQARNELSLALVIERLDSVRLAVSASLLEFKLADDQLSKLNQELQTIDMLLQEMRNSNEFNNLIKINQIREKFLALMLLVEDIRSNKLDSVYLSLESALHLLALYWPLYNKCIFSNADLNEENGIPTTEGYLISVEALPAFFAQSKLLNSKTNKMFNERDLSYLLGEAEKRKLVVSDAKKPAVFIGTALGILGAIAFACTIAPSVVLILGLAVLVLGVCVPPLIEFSLGAALVILGWPALVMGGLGCALGGLINWFRKRPAFIDATYNNKTTEARLLLKEQLKEKLMIQGQVQAKPLLLEEKANSGFKLSLQLNDKNHLFLILKDQVISKPYKLRLLQECRNEIVDFIATNKLLKHFVAEANHFKILDHAIYKALLSINLHAYKKTRSADIQPEYYHCYGRFFGYSKTQKIFAVTHAIQVLEQGENIQVGSDKSLRGALNSGDLGEICRPHLSA